VDFKISNQPMPAALGVLSIISILLLYVFHPESLGLLGIALSVVGILLSRSILMLVLAFLNVSVFIAFDYYLSAKEQIFEFYDGQGNDISSFAIATQIFYIFLIFLDIKYIPYKGLNYIAMPTFTLAGNKKLYYLSIAFITYTLFFIQQNVSFISSGAFDLEELDKFSFLEYISVFVFLGGISIGNEKQKILFITLVSTLIATCLLASYRMVAVIYLMALVIVIFQGEYFRKNIIVFLWVCAFILLASISYIRGGVYEFTFLNILGYKDFGYLDNTFSGVIETSLIYSTIYTDTSLIQRFIQLVGLLLPMPGSFIPNEMIYYYDLGEKYVGRIPGGGMMTGFFYYFDYITVPIFSFYFILVFKSYSNPLSIYSNVILFVACSTITRWWLYGPYVLFKIFGVCLFIYFVVSCSEYFIGRKKHGQ
jgi:hypothetical protein